MTGGKPSDAFGANMEPISFDTALVDFAANNAVVVSLFNGEPSANDCVAILNCNRAAAVALHVTLGRALKDGTDAPR